jgi:GNAT superfamily N-acetyltransferase
MNTNRRLMSLDLADVPSFDVGAVFIRTLVDLDEEALARLMFDAYRGTIDDEGQSFEDAKAEVRRTFDGGYGEMIWDASFVAAERDGAGFDSASVVTLWRGSPLLAFSMTQPAAQRRGLAFLAIAASMRALAARGHSKLSLVVTCGNTRAERLYEKLGFRDIPLS